MHAVDRIFNIYERAKYESYIGESVSQTEHALQAAMLAVDAGAEPHVVVASLLHDIGNMAHLEEFKQVHDADLHTHEKFGIINHAEIGAEFLRRLNVHEDVCALVELHAQAKRYLCTVDEQYLAQLSVASQNTFVLQRGAMSAAETREFEQNKRFHDALRVRSYDDGAKVTDTFTFDLEHFRDIVSQFIMTK